MGGDCPGYRNTYGLGYSYLMFISKIWDRQTDKQTDRQTDRQTDTTIYRVAPQLKMDPTFVLMFMAQGGLKYRVFLLWVLGFFFVIWFGLYSSL